MPRIYDSEGNALDYCKKCFPSATEAVKKFGADISYDDLHPSYEEDIEYNCEKCNKKLTSKDN